MLNLVLGPYRFGGNMYGNMFEHMYGHMHVHGNMYGHMYGNMHLVTKFLKAYNMFI